MPPDRPIRLAVVNDYEIIVKGLAAMLQPFGDRVRVVELDAGDPAREDVDLVLFDTFAQEQGSKIDVHALTSERGQPRPVIYSWSHQPQLVRDSLRAGAAGYLSKGLEAEGLVRALEQIHDGQVVVPAGGSPTADRGAGWPGQQYGLSMREAEVIALVTKGLSNQEIADRCYLSINSVKTYLRTAYRKLGVERRAQAVRWGIAHGFAPEMSRADFAEQGTAAVEA